MTWSQETEDRMMAAIDLIARMGASAFEVGHLEDDVARWWARATWRGVKVHVDELAGPAEAAEALAEQLLEGGTCAHCGRRSTLGDGDGCHWRREGRRWLRGCVGQVADDDRLIEHHERGTLPPEAHLPRAERRRRQRHAEKYLVPDADYGVLPCWAADADALDEARQTAHDRLIELMGDRRTGPVHWMHADGATALEWVRKLSSTKHPDDDARMLGYYRQLRSYLRLRGGWLVVAMAQGVPPARSSSR